MDLQDVKWIGLTRVSTGTVGGLLCMRYLTVGFHKARGFARLAEEPLASQEWPCA